MIERNNCGAQVVDQLKNTYAYENIVSYGTKVGPGSFNKIGVQAHTNTKYKGVVNMRYWMNEVRALKIRDLKTLNELKGFVRYPNGTWAAKQGSDSWDDRVMSLMWGLMILETELCEKYFEVAEYDKNKKPLKINSLDYGVKYFINPTSIYSNEKMGTDGLPPLPIVISQDGNQEHNEIADLESQGYRHLS
jgi:hypothetical protein